MTIAGITSLHVEPYDNGDKVLTISIADGNIISIALLKQRTEADDSLEEGAA